MIQAVFFDIDGTYYDHRSKRVLPQTIAAVNKLKKNGYKVVLCSGRALSLARKVPVFDGVEWDGFIGGAGNFVYDEHWNCIWKNTFSNEQMQQIFQLGKQLDLAMYVTGEEDFITRELTQKEIELLDIFHLEIPEHIQPWSGQEVHMLSLLGGLTYDYSSFTSITGIVLTPSCDQIMDVLPANGSKARGISQMLNYFQIPQGNYLAFGDNLNDKEMLMEAEIGVAMGNCHPQLKAYADRICAPSDEPGIANTLIELGLIS